MKLKIKIIGPKVHNVGYRPWLTDMAIDAGLQGFFYATNHAEGKSQAVVVLAEGAEPEVRHFESIVRGGKPQYAEVDSISAED